MSETSGIQVPASVEFIDDFTGSDFGKIVKLRLPESERDKFVEQNHLRKVKDIGRISIVQLQEIEKVDLLEHFPFKLKGNYYYLADCKPGNAWNVLLDRDSGELWFEVLHPDASGDGPPCEK